VSDPREEAASSGDLLVLPTSDGVAQARAELAGYVDPTPLVRSELLSRALSADVWIKNETVSPVASFKLRGAIVALLRTSDLRGAVTSSTGNHGQGVALAARMLGVPSHVFLPDEPNPVKRRMIAAFGATIHTGGHDLDAAKETAIAFASEESLRFVDDGESLDLMEGAGTVGAEIAAELDRIDVVYVPMGSGTLATGVAAAMSRRHPDARLVAVQAAGAPAMAESFRSARLTERPVSTVADGLICRVPARRALAGVLSLVDDVTTIPDRTLLMALRTMLTDAHVLTEPAGAAALAGAWAHRASLVGRTVVLVASGANVTAEVLGAALAGPGLADGEDEG
jgi:threonine dehydratase